MFDTTIVIPTKNRISMLKRAIASLAIQHELPKQVIIIDDCSAVKVSVQDFSEYSNLNLQVINNIKSFGGSYSRNIGIKMANTKYITFLDDDDLFMPDYLKEIKIQVENNTEDKIGFYSSKKFVLSSSLDKVFKENVSTNIITTKDLLVNNAVGTTSCVTIPKKSLEDINYFDEGLPAFQDYDCWLRLSFNGVKFYPVSKAFIYYTINIQSNQISGNFNNHIKAKEIILEKDIPKEFFSKLEATLSFFTAKSIHRKKYIFSLLHSIPILLKKPKAIALLIPYRILNKFGVYTS